MKQAITTVMILVLSTACATVSDMGSGAWRKTKSLFGAGEEKTGVQKITVERYPSRTVISTVEQPEMQVQTKPQKVQVQPRATLESLPAQAGTPEGEASTRAETTRERRRARVPLTGPRHGPVPLKRAGVAPDERRLQEKIDRTVEELRRKHQRQRMWGIF